MSVRVFGLVANLALRAAIVAILADALLHPDDRRYAEKAIGTRGLVIIPASLLVPAVHLLRRRRGPYPIAIDNLNLSLYALDLGGNWLDLYDRFTYFDAVPHFHGTGVSAIVIGWALRLQPLGAFGLANAVHIVLEAQEYYSDVLFGLRNVRGTWDVVNDLLAGLGGAALYAAAWHALRRGRGSR